MSKLTGRRWFQFSLRSLLLLTSAVAIWLGWTVETARRQREAIKAIEAMGGEVGEADPLHGIPQFVVFMQHAVIKDDGSEIMPPGYTDGLFAYGLSVAAKEGATFAA